MSIVRYDKQGLDTFNGYVDYLSADKFNQEAVHISVAKKVQASVNMYWVIVL